MNQYIPILVFIAIAMGTAVVVLIISTFLGPKITFPEKAQPFECGKEPIVSPKSRFLAKFYLVGLFFMVFHIEAVFLYPVAVLFKDFGVLALVDMGIFILVLVVGLAYIWKKGALEWD